MKILLVQTSFLGDTILSTPVIKGIKTLYPDSELWMMTTPLSKALVERDPLLTGVIPFDKRGEQSGFRGMMEMKRRLQDMGFEKIYTLHKSHRTAALLWLTRIKDTTGFRNARMSFLYRHTAERFAEDHDVIRNLSLLSGETDISALDDDLRLFAPSPDEVTPAARDIVKGKKPYIMLVPGSAWETKMWHWQGFRETAVHFIEKGYKIVMTGAPPDIQTNRKVAEGLEVIDLAGKTTISEAMLLTKHADLVVCNDSMALHMASAFKTPNVAVFCATSPSFGFTPWKNRAEIVETDLECRPCAPHGSRKCPNGTELCMTQPAAKVIEAAERLLSD